MKFIATADLHIRDDKPLSRGEDKIEWRAVQGKALRWLFNLARQEGATVLGSGDIFDVPRVSPESVNMLLTILRDYPDVKFFAIAGNHDLPWHSWDQVDRSSFGNLWYSGLLTDPLKLPITFAHFGETDYFPSTQFAPIRMHHELVFASKIDMPPMVNARTAEEIAVAFPHNKWILLGDMHHAFHWQKDGQHVINPGCLIRQTADLIDYSPGVYLFDSEEDWVERIPFEDGAVFNTIYLQKEQEKMERVSAFVEALSASSQVSLSFEDNVERAILENTGVLGEELPIIIKDLIQRAREIEKN